MTYLEPKHLNNCRLDTMHTTFIHLLRHMAKELHLFTIRPTRSSMSRDYSRESKVEVNGWSKELEHSSWELGRDHHHSGVGSRFMLDEAHGDEESRHAETPKKSLMLLFGPLQYYRELIAQAAEFFQVWVEIFSGSNSNKLIYSFDRK